MDPSGGRDSRYNLNYSMSMMSEASEIYGNPNVTLARPPSGLGQVIMGRGGGGGGGSGGGLMNTQNSQCGNNNITVRGIKRTNSDCYDHDRSGMGVTQNLSVLENCGSSGGNNSAGVTDVVNVDDSYTTLTQQNKKSPPSNGKKTKGRVKIKMEYIDNKLRRYTTFSKRKTGIMKKAYELSTLTGTQVMLLVASETGHVYTFATRKLQPMITSEAGKALIQTCLNSPDPPTGVNSGDQRMSATGFEETELSYNIADDDSKDSRAGSTTGDSDDSSGPDSPGGPLLNNISSPSTSNLIQINHPQHQNTPMDAHQSSNAILSSSSQQNITSTSGGNASSTLSPGSHHDLKNSSIVYPSALANLPQDVLISLVQAGRLQLHADEDGSHQYITIPLSMMPGAMPTNNKLTIKDTLNINGRESPPNQEVIIKKESNE